MPRAPVRFLWFARAATQWAIGEGEHTIAIVRRREDARLFATAPRLVAAAEALLLSDTPAHRADLQRAIEAATRVD